MYYKKSQDINFRESSSGENFAVLVGRHDSTGATKDHTVALVVLKPGCSSDPHFHKEKEESYYFIEGIGEAVIANERIPVSKGDLIYTSPGEKHEFINNGEAVLKYLVITAPSWHPSDSFK